MAINHVDGQKPFPDAPRVLRVKFAKIARRKRGSSSNNQNGLVGWVPGNRGRPRINNPTARTQPAPVQSTVNVPEQISMEAIPKDLQTSSKSAEPPKTVNFESPNILL